MDDWEGWNYFEKHLSEEHLAWIDRPCDAREVKRAAFQIGDTKAPGPDGFPGCFYHMYSDIVGPSITSGVL